MKITVIHGGDDFGEQTMGGALTACPWLGGEIMSAGRFNVSEGRKGQGCEPASPDCSYVIDSRAFVCCGII